MTDCAVQRPQIVIAGGSLPAMVDAAEAAVLDMPDHAGLFQRGGEIVRVIRLESAQGGVIRRAAGTPMIVRVEPGALVETFTSAAQWLKPDARSQKLKPRDCPASVASAYGSRVGQWRLRPLAGVIDSPTLRHDGSLLSARGYDERSGLLFQSDRAWPVISAAPDREDAIEALDVLKQPFASFPFVTGADRAVFLCAALTALIRRSLRAAPLFAFSAPTMGTGKSLLADCVSLLATGRAAPAMSQGAEPEEDRKRIFAALMNGDALLMIDNCERPLEGATLCSLLTQAELRDRILGESRNATVGTGVTVLATGNNLSARGDMRTRLLLCHLDAGLERPEERSFAGDLRADVLAMRGELVAAGLTVMLAYDSAGRPAQAIKPFGRFEDWSDRIRSALVWLGEADPCETRERIDRTDDATAHHAALLNAWHQAFGTRAETVRVAMDNPSAELKAAMQDVAADRHGEINGHRLGKWLQKMEGRIHNGRKFARGTSVNDRATWRVEQHTASRD